MSKLSFRARQLDANKALPVYQSEELPDLSEFSTINRAVPQMPTGMEKEEESEHHLQRAISAQQVYGDTQQLVIPTPDSEELKNIPCLVRNNFKQPKQYIHVQAYGLNEDVPEYDLDSEDEEWLKGFNKKKEILSALQLESILDRLEKGMGAQGCMSYGDAKALLQENEDLVKPVYEYWSKKREKLDDPSVSLIPQVRGEKRDGTSTNDPYVAFRRRTEKMQTRKNRKNDEAGYERMLKLRRDLKRACTILDMVKRREQTKKDLLELTVDVFEKRYSSEDFTGQILQQCLDLIRYQPPAINLTVPSTVQGEQLTPGSNTDAHRDIELMRKRKHEERAHLHKNDYIEAGHKRPKGFHHHAKIGNQVPMEGVHMFSDEEETGQLSPTQLELPSEPEEDEEDPDGRYAFKRKKGVKYLPARLDSPSPYPWVDPAEGGLGDKRFRYNCTSISRPNGLIGFARRRIGRGGRIYFDRAWTPASENLEDFETLLNASMSSSLSLPNGFFPYDHLTGWKRLTIPHYRPKSPTKTTSSPSPPPQPSSSPSSETTPGIQSTSTGQPRPRLHRSFSTQPRSKFSLNTSPTNGLIGTNLSHSNLTSHGNGITRNSLPNGPVVSQSSWPAIGPWTSSSTLSSTPNKNVYSTAPIKAVYALNFPLNSSTSSQLLSNSLVRGNAPFSPTSTNSPSSSTANKSSSLTNLSNANSELEISIGRSEVPFKRQSSIDVVNAT
ncbi:enhancer of polycomb homolog 1-like [Actinia tenebrosa]|uniref:Enhancer of polycomb-like protein n=1 Tax=Actinia tenebrosa TaxID=6105 RepID=A0A6P8JAR2_ACTTE|nr:enhancer of polycomb homolog 1-like [Actinia tenebrosa]